MVVSGPREGGGRQKFDEFFMTDRFPREGHHVTYSDLRPDRFHEWITDVGGLLSQNTGQF